MEVATHRFAYRPRRRGVLSAAGSVPASMKAMVLAAGLGTRLKPITFEIPKPMVPVLDRPVMAHIVGMLERQGFDQLIANLHYFPDTIRDYFGDRLEYRFEEELLGTAGGVRNVARLLRRRPGGDRLGRRAHRHRPQRARRAPPQRGRHRHAHGEEGARHARVRGGHPRRRRPHPGLPGEARPRRGALRPRQLRHLLLLAARSSTTSPSADFADWAQRRVPGAARERRPVPRARDRPTTGTTSARSRSCARAPSTRSPASCGSRSPRARAPGRAVEVIGRRARSGSARAWRSARACG